MNQISAEDRNRLCRAAREVAAHSYSPYSGFRVGAAVYDGSKIYVGTNVENSRYGLALCAERAALCNAIASGAKEITAIAIVCIDAKQDSSISESVPCGACRQWIAELSPQASIIICGQEESFSIQDLLPFPFSIQKSVSG
jgi:cytidine deaminase